MDQNSDVVEFRGAPLLRSEIQALTHLEEEVTKLLNRETPNGRKILIKKCAKQNKSEFGFYPKGNVVEGLTINFDRLTQIPLTAFSFPHLKRLDMSNVYINQVPDEIANLSLLEELELASVALQSISPQLGQLHNLKVLHINNNVPMKEGRYVTLPDAIGNLTQLLDLDLSGLRMHSLPPSIKGLSALRRLICYNCEMESLPDDMFENMDKLAGLGLLGNKLYALPVSIGRCVNLEDLILKFNSIAALPESTGQLQRLRRLYIDCNPLKEMPEELEHLTSLECLYAASTDLSQFPLPVLKLKKLTNLSLGSKIPEVPPEISVLKNLVFLDLSENPLRILPESIGTFKNLTHIGLRDTLLQQLPETITQLKHLKNLDASGSRLKKLPTSIGNLESLEDLNLRNNHLTSLPESLGQCRHLKWLKLDGNSIQEIPTVVQQIPKITIMYKKGKKSKTPPREMGKGDWDFMLCTVDEDYIPTSEVIRVTLDILHQHHLLPVNVNAPLNNSRGSTPANKENDLPALHATLQQLVQQYSPQNLTEKKPFYLNYPFDLTRFRKYIIQSKIPFANKMLSTEAFLEIAPEPIPRAMSDVDTIQSRFIIFGYGFGNGHWDVDECKKLETLIVEDLHEFMVEFETRVKQKLKVVWDWAD